MPELDLFGDLENEVTDDREPGNRVVRPGARTESEGRPPGVVGEEYWSLDGVVRVTGTGLTLDHIVRTLSRLIPEYSVLYPSVGGESVVSLSADYEIRGRSDVVALMQSIAAAQGWGVTVRGWHFDMISGVAGDGSTTMGVAEEERSQGGAVVQQDSQESMAVQTGSWGRAKGGGAVLLASTVLDAEAVGVLTNARTGVACTVRRAALACNGDYRELSVLWDQVRSIEAAGWEPVSWVRFAGMAIADVEAAGRIVSEQGVRVYEVEGGVLAASESWPLLQALRRLVESEGAGCVEGFRSPHMMSAEKMVEALESLEARWCQAPVILGGRVRWVVAEGDVATVERWIGLMDRPPVLAKVDVLVLDVETSGTLGLETRAIQDWAARRGELTTAAVVADWGRSRGWRVRRLTAMVGTEGATVGLTRTDDVDAEVALTAAGALQGRATRTSGFNATVVGTPTVYGFRGQITVQDSVADDKGIVGVGCTGVQVAMRYGEVWELCRYHARERRGGVSVGGWARSRSMRELVAVVVVTKGGGTEPDVLERLAEVVQ